VTGFSLRFTDEAARILRELESQSHHAVKLKKTRKALAMLQQNPRHPGLNSHKYHSLHGIAGEDVWDSYIENHTPGAWRLFWHYGPGKDVITIVTMGPHPD
jgi:mRNA-degrading endonuclease YafQ of YafQ-DinJ toxin-antitoxin module